MLDEATGKWGIRVNRVELKSIDPPPSIQDSMEKQMRADREKRAAILTAEGVKQSQILTAEGEKQAAILKAEGAAAVGDPRRPKGRRRRSTRCSRRSTTGNADQKLLAYQYLQMLPQIAQGSGEHDLDASQRADRRSADGPSDEGSKELVRPKDGDG